MGTLQRQKNSPKTINDQETVLEYLKGCSVNLEKATFDLPQAERSDVSKKAKVCADTLRNVRREHPDWISNEEVATYEGLRGEANKAFDQWDVEAAAEKNKEKAEKIARTQADHQEQQELREKHRAASLVAIAPNQKGSSMTMLDLVSGKREITPNHKGKLVDDIVSDLGEAGIITRQQAHAAKGHSWETVMDAVRQFQESKGINPTGRMNKETYEALGRSLRGEVDPIPTPQS